MAKLDIITIEDKLKELVESLDRDNFLYDFLKLYDFKDNRLADLRKKEHKIIKNQLVFEVVPCDKSVVARVAEIEEEWKNKKSKPRYIIATNYTDFASKDTKTEDTLNIKFEELPTYADFFLAWKKIEKVDYSRESPADMKAAERFTKLYDELRKINTFEDRTQEEKAFNLFLIRLLFLLFAEDTDIMTKGVFTNAMKTRSREDGSDLGALLNEIYNSLDVSDRSSQAVWLQEFPYVNGKLFKDAGTALSFDKKTRKYIIEAGELLNWNEINPDILGAMIQTVANKEQRAVTGMHYTSVENIMKLIKPLFLDNLTESYQAIMDKANANEGKDITERTKRENRQQYVKELQALHERMGNIQFLDPACGSGNFLIITYKEMRRLEIKLLQSIGMLSQDGGIIDMFEQSKISLNHFHGIEVDDFAHEVARLSLWIAEHQMNVEAEKAIHMKQAFLPLREAGNIYHGNALRVNWSDVVPHTQDDEIYIIGNPPYIGAKRQNTEQKEDLRLVLGDHLKHKKMDYIVGWFYKGVEFINSANAKLAFVTTNSIFQGEQVAIVWEPLLDKMTIDFAYTSFKWGNSASNNAGVTVAIVGLANKENENEAKYIFDETLSRTCVKSINAYLVAGDNILVKNISEPMNELPRMFFGNQPRDGGNLILSDTQEKNLLLEEIQELEPHIKKYVGGKEFIQGTFRYCIWLNEEEYEKIKIFSSLRNRIERIKQIRLKSTTKSTVYTARFPYSFSVRGSYDKAYNEFLSSGKGEFIQILVPSSTSENREYVPMGFVTEDTIISNSAYVIYNAPIWVLGLLMSRLHMVWLRSIGGKLKTDYRYSAGTVYNTFPVPTLTKEQHQSLEEAVWDILELREELGGTLEVLYSPATMPTELRQAHQRLDELVEQMYQDTPFTSDAQRLSHLLKRYTTMRDNA